MNNTTKKWEDEKIHEKDDKYPRDVYLLCRSVLDGEDSKIVSVRVRNGISVDGICPWML